LEEKDTVIQGLKKELDAKEDENRKLTNEVQQLKVGLYLYALYQKFNSGYVIISIIEV